MRTETPTETEPTPAPPDTPERRAYQELVDRIKDPESPWGMAWFTEHNGLATWTTPDPETGALHHYVAKGVRLNPGETRLLPFRVDETRDLRANDGPILHGVIPHEEALEKTGVFGLVAALGRERYEGLAATVRAADNVEILDFRQEKRNTYARKSGKLEWLSRRTKGGVENWFVLDEDDEHRMQPGLAWFSRLVRNQQGVKKIPAGKATGGKAGHRFHVELVKPYVAVVPPESEQLWHAPSYTAQHPPRAAR